MHIPWIPGYVKLQLFNDYLSLHLVQSYFLLTKIDITQLQQKHLQQNSE
jgi:hypothetical protein